MLRSYLYRNLIEAGCDEAGRGSLAGPVAAAAVILPKNYKHPILNDSKMLSAKQRYELRDEIINSAISWKVVFVDNSEIDEMNILRATIKAMHLAIEGLERQPQFLLIDGNRFFPYKDIKHKTIIKGDGLFFPIAAASVLAKTFRDDYMEKIHGEFPVYGWNRFFPYKDLKHKTIIKGDGLFFPIAAASVLAKTFRDDYMDKIHGEFPVYGWNRNKGYPTFFHRQALLNHGISIYHRKSFSLFNTQLTIDF